MAIPADEDARCEQLERQLLHWRGEALSILAAAQAAQLSDASVIERLEQANLEWEKGHARLSARCSDLEAQLAYMEQSKSWRITKPIRAVGVARSRE